MKIYPKIKKQPSLNSIMNVIDCSDSDTKNLEEYFKKNCKDPENPIVLWYPSAGNDLNDIVEFSRIRCENIGIDTPEIFIHTDYNDFLFKQFQINEIVLPQCYGNQQIRISAIQQLNIKNINIRPIEPNFIHWEPIFPPKLYVIDVDILLEQKENMALHKKIFYFFFENTNFLIDVLIGKGIKVTHMVNVCDGTGLGGGAISVKNYFGFLYNLKTDYVIIDSGYGAEQNQEFIDFIETNTETEPLNYELEILDEGIQWNGSEVALKKIQFFNNHN